MQMKARRASKINIDLYLFWLGWNNKTECSLTPSATSSNSYCVMKLYEKKMKAEMRAGKKTAGTEIKMQASN